MVEIEGQIISIYGDRSLSVHIIKVGDEKKYNEIEKDVMLIEILEEK